MEHALSLTHERTHWMAFMGLSGWMIFALSILSSNVLLGAGNVMDGQMADWANLGAVAVLSMLLVWVILKGIPAIHESHREDRCALMARVDTVDERRREDSERLRETLDKMIAHCMRERS